MTASSADGTDLLQLANGRSQVELVASRPADGVATGCLRRAVEELREDEALSEVAARTRGDGRSDRGEHGETVWAVRISSRTTEGEEPVEDALYVGSRPLGDGAVLRVRHAAPLADFDEKRDELLGELSPALPAPGGTDGRGGADERRMVAAKQSVTWR